MSAGTARPSPNPTESVATRSAPRVLVVEDDAAIAMAVQDRLESEGYAVTSVADGEDGLIQALAARWDLIILDLMLPGRDGLAICRDLRAAEVGVPVLMLTARSETVDKVVGLRLGADDYLAKPFAMIELLARVEALLRRRTGPARAADFHTIDGFVFDVRKGELRTGDDVIALTAYEFKLLRYLCEHRGEVVERDTLLHAVWGYDSVPHTRTVDVHVASLRKKLRDNRRQARIVTIRGLGYKLAAEPGT